MYRSSKQKYFSRNGSFTPSVPETSSSRSGVATLVGASSRSGSKRSGSKQWPPLASLGRESWPTTVVNVAEFSPVRGIITSIAPGALMIQATTGALHEVFLLPSTFVTKVGRPAAISDLVIGGNVRIVLSTPGRPSALTIDIELSYVVGRVVSVNAMTLKISGRDGVLRTVIVGGSTVFVKSGEFATLDDVVVGSYIAAQGTYNAGASSVAASLVEIGRPQNAAGPSPSEANSRRSLMTGNRTDQASGGVAST